ncbi:sulfatase-like hydrolase/transferase [Membranihabitans marinus]|uniref:sulfatase-like hydrolase/transferase n=1 Tax=Membranihabitans marinus TaxID=1227546 RepID=UPI001F029627|nr:sulfatase-like hydrolase/transferase [Membranihabitans marinus]
MVRLYLGLIALYITMSCSSNSSSQEAEDETFPNIVFIVSDDQSWTDYSFMGHPTIETKNIDRLLAEGTTYTRGYLTSPVCSPSLASIITGLYPHQHGVTGNDPHFVYDGPQPRDRKEWLRQRQTLFDVVIENFVKHPSLPTLLSTKGYKSFQSGKWWGGSYKEGGFTEGMTFGDPEHGGRHGDKGLEIGRDGMDPIYDFIDRTTGEQSPFFVWYAPFLPHTPHTPPDSLLAKYIDKAPTEYIAKYWAMVEWFDITVGQLLGALDERGLTENTIIVYVNDNGWVQEPNQSGFKWPSKQSPFDMGMRSPISFKWPNHIPVKMDTSSFVSSIDLVPTILKILDIEPTEEMLGIDILNPAEVSDRKAVFSEDFHHDIMDVNDALKSLEHRMMMQSPWKLIVPKEKGSSQEVNRSGGGSFISMLEDVRLYNIVSDPHETTNLAGSNPDVVEQMLRDMNEWWDVDSE